VEWPAVGLMTAPQTSETKTDGLPGDAVTGHVV